MAELSHYRNNPNDPDYRPIKVISNGSFGFVFQAEHVITKQKVALKRIQRVNSDLGREYDVLTLIRGSQNIVDIKDIFFTRKQTRVVQNIIFEFVDDNLEDLIERTSKEGKTLPEMTVKSYVYQLLNGLHNMHQNKIAHRDLKPENILLSKNGKIKICDFGHSKILDENGKNTPFVVSRVYRAPELLLCITKYSLAIDIWSVGCILAQLFLLKPVFDGNTEGNQLFKIFRSLGSLSAQQRKQYEQRIPFDKTLLKSMGSYPKQDLKQKFKMVEDLDNFIDLFTKLLKYIPEKRLTAKQAMEHPFFNNVKKRLEEEDAEQSTKN